LGKCVGNGGKIKWERMNVIIEFKAFEVFIAELCSGKNSLEKILERCTEYWKADQLTGVSKIRESVVNYLLSLADKRLIVFRVLKWDHFIIN
jgi:hypothetical protein